MEVCKISDVIRDARIRSGMTQEALHLGFVQSARCRKLKMVDACRR